MKFINNDFVSREYYEGACAYYQEAITRLTEENKLYETKLNKITDSIGLLKTALNDYNDIFGIISKVCSLQTELKIVVFKIGEILDDHEQETITRLTEENKLYRTKLKKITGCMELLKTVLNDYDDIFGIIPKVCRLQTELKIVDFKLGRILDDHEMF